MYKSKDVPNIIALKNTTQSFGGSLNLNKLSDFILIRYGYILANIYGKECIAKIDPANGNVVGWILLNGLAEKTLGKENTDGIKVMNGIAVIPEEEDTMYVTGKLWPTLYKLSLKPVANRDAFGSPSEIKGICMIDPQDPRF